MEHSTPISLKSLYQAVRRRWRVFLTVTLVVFAAGTTGVLLLQKKYTSTATILLAPGSDQLAAQSPNQGAAMTDPFFVHSETDVASDDSLSREVIQQFKLWTNPDFLPLFDIRQILGLPPKKNDTGLTDSEVLLDNVLKYYQNDLDVSNDGRSNTLTIGFTASDPRMAANIANAHAEAYLQEQSTRRQGLQTKALEWLRKEVEARAEAVRDADAEVQRFQLKNGIVSANDTTIIEQRLGQLTTQLVDARRQLSTKTTLLEQVRKLQHGGGDAGSVADMLDDTALNNLMQSRAETEASISTLEKRFAADHPTLVKQRGALAGINNALNQHLARLESEASSSAAWWQRQVDDLSHEVDAETSRKVGQDRVSVGLPSLVAEAQVKRAVFETVTNRYQTLLAEMAFAAPSAALVARAVPSSRPSFPKVPLFLAVVAIVALLAGVASSALLEMRNGASMGLTAMADAVGIRPLVSIPRFRDTSRGKGSLKIQDPRLFVESIRFLREAVLAGRQEGQGKICLVTSVLPRQGKSLVAMSLSRAIARANRRALFLELDLRRPTGSILARRPWPVSGVAAVLAGRASISDVVIRDTYPKLDLMLAEENANSALDHLTSATLATLLTELRSRYDAIIIDSPPLGIVSDALTLTPLVDQIILVAKDMDSSLNELQRGTRLLRERGAVVPGLVLTSVDPSQLSSVDKKTLHRYVMGVPEVIGSAQNAPEPVRNEPRIWNAR
jgi:polysaccharide biosynthesis transport protein